MIRKFIQFPVLGLTALLIVFTSNNNAALIDFENQTVGGIVNTLQAERIDVTFSSNVTDFGLGLITSSTSISGNATTSWLNYLGVNDGSSDLFIQDDSIELIFSQPITELMVSIITGSNTPLAALGINNAFDTVFNDAPAAVLGFDEVFTLSLLGTTPFTTATVFRFQ